MKVNRRRGWLLRMALVVWLGSGFQSLVGCGGSGAGSSTDADGFADQGDSITGDDAFPRGDDGATDDGAGADGVGSETSDVPASTHLEPESGWESCFEPDTGSDVVVQAGRNVPAAFSGRVYAIIMDEQVTDSSDDTFTAVFRLVPGGDVLDRSWIDIESATDRDRDGSICWSGEAFVGVLPVRELGIRVLAVDEAGRLLRAPVLLPDDVSNGEGVVLCPATGPVVLTFGQDGPLSHRLHQLERDGSPTGTYAELPPFVIAWNIWSKACAEAGDEVACITDADDATGEPARIVFIARDGTVRRSAPLPEPVPCDFASPCDLVFLGDGLGLVWVADEGGKPVLRYGRTDRDGNVTVGPVSTGRRVGGGVLGFHAATSGSTLLVVTDGDDGDLFADGPEAHLLALDGTLRGDPVQVNRGSIRDYDPDHPPYWMGMAVFWEGDAYSAIWNTHRDWTVAYRRFRVVP